MEGVEPPEKRCTLMLRHTNASTVDAQYRKEKAGATGVLQDCSRVRAQVCSKGAGGVDKVTAAALRAVKR